MRGTLAQVDFVSVPVIAALSVVTAVIFGLAAQRLLGVRLGLVRLLAAGVFALVIYPPLVVALVGDYAGRELTGADTIAAFWLAMLAMAGTILASMVVLVVLEAFVPLGSLPPPLVWGRGVRARLARARRYSQIVGDWVAARVGAVPAGYPPSISWPVCRITPARWRWPQVEAVLAAELGVAVDAVFARVDRIPLAAELDERDPAGIQRLGQRSSPERRRAVCT